MEHVFDELARAALSPACGILYAEDFDDEPPAPPPLPEPDPVFSAAELDEARLQAADTARAEVFASAELAALQSRSVALADVASELRRLSGDVAAEVERSSVELSYAVMSLLCAALPSLMESTAGREVSGLLGRLLPGLHAEKQVTVRVSPQVADRIGADLLALDEDARSRVVLVPTDALLPGDLRVSWHEGRLVRDTGEIHRAAQAILAAASQMEATGG